MSSELTIKNWDLQGKIKPREISEIIKLLLSNRGLKTKREIDDFLTPKLESVTVNSVGISEVQLDKTLQRIKKAVQKKETIVVFGDYDVDGICGSAILWETLHEFSDVVFPYIPHRIDEGYGLSIKGIENVLEKYSKTSLIITVDNGIVAFEAVEFATKKGIDVVITDHHVVAKKKPKAFSIFHTTQLCGTGVAWLLSQELLKIYGKDIKQTDHLALVALATVADLVSLKGSNRTLLTFGLETLRKTKRQGIIEICKEAVIDQPTIGTYEIGHVIAPRLNAMGRLEYAMDSLRLLCTHNKKKAYELAQLLGSTNKERQQLTFETVSHAISNLKSQISNKKKLVFISHESYQPGVIGLVAGRLVEEFYVPSIVVSKGERYSKASARSISGFNIIEFIRTASHLLVDAGGHPMAAGFTVETTKLGLLQKHFETEIEKHLSKEILKRMLRIDCELPLEMVSSQLFIEIQKLEPFGMGNPVPLFVSRNLEVVDVRLVGKENKHLKVKVRHDGTNLTIDGIAFGLGDRSPEFKIGQRIDIVYSIEQDEWNGNKKLQLKIRDIQSN